MRWSAYHPIHMLKVPKLSNLRRSLNQAGWLRRLRKLMHGLKLYKKKLRFSRIEILSFFSILILSFRCSFCLFFSKFQVIAMDEREPDCCGDNCGENRCNCALPALRCDKTAQTNRCRPWLLGSNFLERSALRLQSSRPWSSSLVPKRMEWPNQYCRRSANRRAKAR